MRKILLRAAGLALAGAVLFTPGQAQAWWRGGFVFVGPPIVFGPPVIYAPPPPVYYAPAPVYAAPPAGQTCYAGAYVCPLDRPTPSGAGCSCPTNTGRAYGRAR